MNNLKPAGRPSLLKQILPYQLWDDFRTRWRFKFTLPKVEKVTLEGVQLEVKGLSSVMKNNLLLGRYEVQERTFAEQFLTRQDSVLEVGGAIGFIGLFCQLRLGITQYTTVEANPGTVERLRRNYEINGRTANVWNLALAAQDGEVTLNIGNEFWENSLVAGSGGKTVKVPGVSLSTLLSRMSYSPTAFIMDIEGAEQYVNFRQLPPSVCKIIVELHPNFIGHQATYRIVGELLNLGFHVEREEGGTFLFLRP